MAFTCIYCGDTFEPNEVLFARYSEEAFADSKYDRQAALFANFPASQQQNYLLYKVDEAEKVVYSSCDLPTEADVFPSMGREPNLMEGPVGPSVSGVANMDIFGETTEKALPAEEKATPTGEKTVRVSHRLCPKCHFTIPEDFGEIPLHQIMLVGDRAAGKTTYLVNLAQRLDSVLVAKNLGSINMAEESAHYYNAMMKEYETMEGNMSPTPLKPICPLYYSYRNIGQNGEVKECAIVIYDIAGEAFMKNPQAREFIQNHEGIKTADALMLIVDPNQVADVFVSEGADDKATTDIMASLNWMIPTVADLMDNVNDVAVVLTKFDKILAQPIAGHQFLRNNVMLQDMGVAHYSAVDIAMLKNVHNSIEGYLNTWPAFRTRKLSDLVRSIIYQKRKRKLSTCRVFGTSNYTMVTEADGQFRFENQYQQTGVKYRIAEPILNFLAIWGMVPTREGSTQGSAAAPPPPKPVKRGLFGRKS